MHDLFDDESAIVFSEQSPENWNETCKAFLIALVKDLSVSKTDFWSYDS